METDCPIGILIDLSEGGQQEVLSVLNQFQTPCTTSVEKLKEISSPLDGITRLKSEEITISPTHIPYQTFEKHIKFSDDIVLQQVPKNKSPSDESDCKLLEDEVFDFQDSASSPASSLSDDETFLLGEISDDRSSNGSSTICISKPNGQNLSIQEMVEVFKEATTVALHLENYSRDHHLDNPASPPLAPLLRRPLNPMSLLEKTGASKSGCVSDIENQPPLVFDLDQNPINEGTELELPAMQKNGHMITDACTTTSISRVLRSNRIKATAPKSPTLCKGPVKARILGSTNGAHTSFQTSNQSDGTTTRLKAKLFSRPLTAGQMASQPRNSAIGGLSNTQKKPNSTSVLPGRKQQLVVPPPLTPYTVASNFHGCMPKREFPSSETKNTKSFTRRSIEVMCTTPICETPVKSSLSSIFPNRRRSALAARTPSPTKTATGPPPAMVVKRSNSSGAQIKKPLNLTLLARSKVTSKQQSKILKS